ncbi:MAG: Re/Si-specific NAD(P)(+) transhydrogenase subunit alpha [Myxococcales bacterium]|nr:Re/Si-specific NAD(P)(+) transhydrogenase subunit alpha [Myxococcales bacterium]
MLLGVAKETAEGEHRVAITPDVIPKLTKRGLEVLVETGAGLAAGCTDDQYESAGARIGSAAEVWAAAIVVKVQPPTASEIGMLGMGSTLISILQPNDDPARLSALVDRGASAIALERIPRITRAQKMDVLSSMANLAGYRAVMEAAQAYPGFMGAQVTAAGTDPPAKVLIIGAGVAGLAAIGAARALGAEVRAFDVRPAAKEQVESLGAQFLTVELEESGEGEGGYAKTMSKEFIEAEMALFKKQAAEVDIIITTALIPGKRAPVLVTREMLRSMRFGSVVVDLAAEQGGNCECTVPGESVSVDGVQVLGFRNLPSRMARTASRFFSTNVRHLIEDMCRDGGFRVDPEDEIVRSALVVHEGHILPPPERKPAPPSKPKTLRPPADDRPKKKDIMQPTSRAWGTTVGGLAVLVLIFGLGRFAPDDFVKHFTVFVLACFVGWQVIWSVAPALHTPLMSVTNAISGIIIVGGMLQAGRGTLDLATILGAVAILVASINIAGGFLVTHRMLKMFRRGSG